jgi:hypothetical protein
LSRGPGRIEQATAAIFEKHPKRSFTTDELCMRVYRLRHPSWVEKRPRAVFRPQRLPEAVVGCLSDDRRAACWCLSTGSTSTPYLDGRTRAYWAFLSEAERACSRHISQERGAEIYEWTRKHEISGGAGSGRPARRRA